MEGRRSRTWTVPDLPEEPVVEGDGGMGTVFMSEQSEPVRRPVALKVIKAGLDSRQGLARFEAERQALALMDHPDIAGVLEAGSTDDGRPYFVMELVKGVPITRFCDERRPTPRERLELFLPVCKAVRHAHQKGIVHRDLKPSNLLIALDDGRPVPEVIDFGVAKATGPKLTERTRFTEVGSVVGTPRYMTPEQAELNQLDVDTRSDVDSPGVLLYELLTGTTPLEAGRLKEAALLEILRLIREDEPPRPSTRLSTTEEPPGIAASRNVERLLIDPGGQRAPSHEGPVVLPPVADAVDGLPWCARSSPRSTEGQLSGSTSSCDNAVRNPEVSESEKTSADDQTGAGTRTLPRAVVSLAQASPGGRGSPPTDEYRRHPRRRSADSSAVGCLPTVSRAGRTMGEIERTLDFATGRR